MHIALKNGATGITMNYEENNNGNSRILSYFSKTSQLYEIEKYEKVYGYSMNLERLKTTKMTYADALEIVDDAILESSKVMEIRNKDIVLNIHKKESYRRKNKNNM